MPAILNFGVLRFLALLQEGRAGVNLRVRSLKPLPVLDLVRPAVSISPRIIVCGCLLWLLVNADARAQTIVQKVSDAGRIHQGDIIEIDEIGGFDYDWRGKINPEGFLDGFAKIAEPIFARCRTTEEVAESVRVEYAKFLRDPQVRVRIIDRSDRALAYLDGAVRQPQRLRIRRDVDLKELIVIGGGFTDKAGGEISILRPAGASCESSGGDSTRTLNVAIADILSGKPDANQKILSGDIVTVLAVQPVFVIGGVESPGKTSWREGMTVSRAVAAAGGVSDKGVAGSVTVYRNRGAAAVSVDLDKVRDGEAEDVLLKAFDIVEIPLKGAGKRRLPPVVDDPDSRPRSFQTMPLRVIE